jgi:hypothetical protein
MPRFRLLTALALTATLSAPRAGADKPRKATAPLGAEKYLFHDTNTKEHVTIAAEPGDTHETRPNTRLDYFHHGFMPIRIIVTNDSDQALTLDDARILFVGSDNSTTNAATDDDLQRRLFSTKSVAGTKIPMPAPIPSITIHHPPVDKQILADDTDFGFKSTTVEPHSTAAGYLFYDTRSIDDPVLQGATLEIRKVRISATNKALDSFEIPLKPAPAAKPASTH